MKAFRNLEASINFGLLKPTYILHSKIMMQLGKLTMKL